MQLDMHYYAIYYLCLAAGFDPEDAYILAYSSQYVDDAKESEKITLIDVKGRIQRFDPICTQHMSLRSFGEEVSDKVYFPFHFFPIARGSFPDERSITVPYHKNILHQKVFEKILKKDDLYRLGIALHVFADSYAHQNFSGDWSTVNEIKRLRCILPRRIMPANFLKSFFFVAGEPIKRMARWMVSFYLPSIGHLKAYQVPDYPQAMWRYKNYKGNLVLLSNPDAYFQSCMGIFKNLLKLKSRIVRKPLSEQELKHTIQQALCTSGSSKKRIRYWRKTIQLLAQSKKPPLNVNKHLNYNPIEWKLFVFQENPIDLKLINPSLGKVFHVMGSFDEFKKSHFYLFHTAAKEQRIEVLKAVKKDIPRVELSIQETVNKVILGS